jgi:acyl-CoA thioesterase II
MELQGFGAGADTPKGMSSVLDNLVRLLDLEKIEENLFRGQSQDLGWGVVYGGQVLGQALSAAAYTVPVERSIHSLHAYFLRPGDVNAPIVYNVDRIRDGSSFNTRSVVAIQHGVPIFNFSASFQKFEKGLEHQDEMPRVPPPDSLPTEQERQLKYVAQMPEFIKERLKAERPLDSRMVEDDANPVGTKGPARRHVWFKTKQPLKNDPRLHQALLAYASDYAFVTTAMKPHGVTWLTPGMQIASIDHAVWFHAPFRADEWLLHSMESPRAGNARGLVRGTIFSQNGTLVATTMQEGLMRLRE